MTKKNKKLNITQFFPFLKNLKDINSLIVICTFIFNALLLFQLFQPKDDQLSLNSKNYEAGKVADHTVIADRDFDIIDKKSTSIRDYNAQRNITPVFKVYDNITDESMASFDLFIQRFKDYSSENPDTTVFSDFLQKYDDLSADTLQWLFENPSTEQILDVCRLILFSAMSEGILMPAGNDISAYQQDEMFEKWRWANGVREKTEVRFSDALTKEKLKDYVASSADASFAKDLQLMTDLVYVFASENCFYDFEETQKKREAILAKAEPIYKTIKKGSVIVEKDFIITDNDMEVIKAIGNVSEGKSNYKKFIAVVFYLIAVYLVSAVFFLLPGVVNIKNKKEVFFLVMLAELFFFAVFLLLKFTNVADNFNFTLFLPVSVFTMIISIVMTQAAGIYFTVIVCMVVLAMGNFSPYPVALMFLNGIMGVIFGKKADTRIDLIIAGLKNGFAAIGFIITLLLFTNGSIPIIIVSSIVSLANGLFSGIVTLGLLPIVEYALNSPTKFRLIELSDLNNPILKKMHNLAPGTFNHSLSVANLAEDACREIGANALLARVGAYYHDIGKIEQASFFVENQKTYNKHNDLKPSMSVSVIKSHVKIGIEKAKELRLPQAVIDIIAQHHGNGLISYFYVKALKLGNKAKIAPYDYSYNEETPKTKEAATVLLADNVEAAVRTLKKPTMSKVEKFVWQIIMSKIETKQITKSELTFNELSIIKKSFVNTLSGAYHSRIEYPDVKAAEKQESKKDDAEPQVQGSAANGGKPKFSAGIGTGALTGFETKISEKTKTN